MILSAVLYAAEQATAWPTAVPFSVHKHACEAHRQIFWGFISTASNAWSGLGAVILQAGTMPPSPQPLKPAPACTLDAMPATRKESYVAGNIC